MAGESIEYDLAAALVGWLGEQLACTPNGKPREVRVGVGQIEDGGCDSLVVSITSVRNGFVGRAIDELPEMLVPGHNASEVGLYVEFTVALARHCWPTDVQRDESGEQVFNRSVGADTEAASASLLIDGRILHAALLHALAHPEVWWTDDADGLSFDYAIGPRSMQRDVGCAGVTIPVIMEIGGLCEYVPCVPPDPEDVVPSEFVGDDRTDIAAVGSVDVRPTWMT